MGAQKARKLSIPAPIATKLHTGTHSFAGKGSSANFDQLDLAEGPLYIATMDSCMTVKHTLSTPLRVRIQNPSCTKLNSCRTGTGSTHGDFA